MPKLTRALVLGATLAAMNLAGITTVASAQANVPARPAAAHPESGGGGLAPAAGRP